MDRDYLAEFEGALVGCHLSIQRREHDWLASLGGRNEIRVSTPWRIVANGRIAFADQDDGQKFGLPAPLDGEAEANTLVQGKAIIEAVVDRQTADLTLHLIDGTRVDVFNHSSGYEGWEATVATPSGGILVIALGGGGVSIFLRGSEPTDLPG